MTGEVAVPGDIALIGYDDIDFAASAVVPISSVRQPAREMGEQAMRLLAAHAADPDAEPRDIRFEPELVIRASTAG